MGKKIQCIGRYVMDGKTLGKGNFARVELATHSVTNCKVAIKIIDTRKIKEEYLKQNLHREARILGQLRHPNIVRLYETLKATTLYCLVTEYASGGELLSYIKMHKEYRLSEDKSRPFVRQIVSAIHYLHQRGVAHRDLKMENIMLDEKKKNIKICDFGLSNTFTEQDLMMTHCGSPEYAAPELFAAGEKYGKEVDIWSLGIIMYAMMCGKLPFTTPYTDQYRRVKLLQQIEKGLVDEHNREMSHLSPDGQHIIRKLIEPSPKNRLPLNDIETHPWVTAGSKLPFFPFSALPRDKTMKSQVMEELATSMDIKVDQVEKTVHENKSDEMSAMFNMMLDRKRVAQGIFDVDHTIKCERRHEGKTARKHRSKSAQREDGTKGKKKVPPALVLPPEINAGHPPHSAGGSGEHENKISLFDLQALCANPTWLGPERRRSRRRSRSPGPLSPAPHLEHEKQGADAFLVPRAKEEDKTGANNPEEGGNLLSPNVAYKTKLTVPQSKPHTLNRGSSLRLSKRRARSCGPSGRGKGPFQRSSSVDVPDTSSEPLTSEAPKQQSPIPRPANLVLRECFSAGPVKLKSTASGTNGPVTSVEVHFSDSSNPCSSVDLLKSSENSSSQILSRLEVPCVELNLCKNLRYPPEPPVESRSSLAGGIGLSVVRPKEKGMDLTRINVFHEKLPRNFLTVNSAIERQCTEGAQAMQLEECEKTGSSDELDFGACPSGLDSASFEKDLEQELADLKLLEMEECEDRVDSTAELISGNREPLALTDASTNSSRHASPGSSKHSEPKICGTLNVDEIEVLDQHSDTASCSSRPPKRPNSAASSRGVSSSTRSSVRSQKFPSGPKLKTPTTPTWMVFKTPIARIESFHSDDFEYFTSEPDKGDKVSLSSVSPNSVHTPTVPCFAYKLNLGKKKPPKLKNAKSKTEMISKGVKYTDDGGKRIAVDNCHKLEPVITDPLLSSGSDTEHHDDTGDKVTGTGKAKIHPMDMEEQEMEATGKGSKVPRAVGNQKVLHANAITKQPNQIQNSVNRNTKNLPGQDTKKKTSIKNSPWKKSFAHFLKRKRLNIRAHSNSNSNNNNNDCSPANNQQQSARNGHAPNSPAGKTDSTGPEDSKVTLSPGLVGNSVPDSIELQSSPIPPRSPSPTPRVFDFTLVSDSPKGKSCLLSWRACRECGVSDASSEEESECNIPLEPNVNLSLKAMPEMNNIQDPTRNFAAYQFTHS